MKEWTFEKLLCSKVDKSNQKEKNRMITWSNTYTVSTDNQTQENENTVSGIYHDQAISQWNLMSFRTDITCICTFIKMHSVWMHTVNNILFVTTLFRD